MSFSITSNVQSAPKTNEEIKLEHELIAGRVAHLREQEKTLQDHTDAIAAAEKYKAELVFRSQELKQEVSRLTDEKVKLAREVEIEQSSLDVARRALELTNQAIEEGQKQLAALEESVRQAKVLADSVQASNKALEDKKTAIAAELDRLDATLREALASHRENVGRLQAEIQRTTDNLAGHTAELEEKKKEIIDHNARLTAVRQQVDQAHKDLADIERHKTAAVAQTREECENLRQQTNKWAEDRRHEIAEQVGWASKQQQINEEKHTKLVMVKKELEKIHNRPIHIDI
jgi:Chromosome segregation ATPases